MFNAEAEATCPPLSAGRPECRLLMNDKLENFTQARRRRLAYNTYEKY